MCYSSLSRRRDAVICRIVCLGLKPLRACFCGLREVTRSAHKSSVCFYICDLSLKVTEKFQAKVQRIVFHSSAVSRKILFRSPLEISVNLIGIFVRLESVLDFTKHFFYWNFVLARKRPYTNWCKIYQSISKNVTKSNLCNFPRSVDISCSHSIP